MPFWHDDVKVHHVFEDLNFDFLIGRPTKTLLKDVPKEGYLNIKLGKDNLHIPIERALKCSVEDPPILEPIEEMMATSVLESFDSDLKEDIEGNPKEEVIKAVKDSNETFELPKTKKPSRPPIELKPLPSGLRYAFLNSDVESPVIISDKLSEEETHKLIAVLEKH